MRTVDETITFERPFSLSSVEEVQPAGTYTVVVDEELIEGLSFLAYRRVATTIYLPVRPGAAGSIQAVTVDPDELKLAHGQDRRLRDDGGADVLCRRSTR
jgi:hypothetical protein